MGKIICSDIDGVVASIEKEMHKRIIAHFGIEVEPDYAGKFNMHERFNVPKDEMRDFIDSELCFGDPAFWLQAEPMEDNLDALHDAWYLGNEIHFITARHNTQRQPTKEWLDNVTHCVFCDDSLYTSLLMNTKQVKHRALKYLGAEIMFEDRLEEAITIANQGFRSYLIDTPYNQTTARACPNLIRVPSIRAGLELEGIL